MASTVTRSQSNRALWDMVEGKIRIMEVQPKNLLQLRDAIMSIWTKISEECFQHLVKSMPRRIKAVLKAKGVQQGTGKVYLKKWPVNVYCSIYFFNNGDMIKKKNIYIYIYISKYITSVSHLPISLRL